jgi:hypothetical protein
MRRREAMSHAVVAILTGLSVWLLPVIAPATPTPGFGATQTASLFHITLTIAGEPVKTGDHAVVTATVTNIATQPVSGATLLLGLVDLRPGQTVPLGLETWTTDPESVALPPLAPGASAAATWRLVMIQPGLLGVYASAMAGANGPVDSGMVTVLPIREKRALNPANVLPVALGEPLLLTGLLVAGRLRQAG